MSGQRAPHTDVGAYALGLLETPDRRAFEAHLGECGSCAAELADFTDIGRLLSGLTPVGEHAEEAPGEVTDLAYRRRRTPRGRRTATVLSAVAAGTVLVAAGATVGSTFGGRKPATTHAHQTSPAEQMFEVGEKRGATDPGSGLTGTVAMESKGWGTHVALKLNHIRGPLVCDLVAIGRSGQKQVVTGWAVPPAGYGVPGSPAPLLVHGGTAIPRTDLSRFEVRVHGGDTLLKIPV
jgi:Putative zinc-finger